MPFNPIQATLAFIFTPDLNQVLLIKKTKPLQHLGLLNGLGGKLEAGETPLACVVREIQEESGLSIPPNKWQFIGNLTWEQWHVTIWSSVLDQDKPSSFPDSNVAWFPVASLPAHVIKNLEWLIPLCLDVHRKVAAQEKTLPVINVVYS